MGSEQHVLLHILPSPPTRVCSSVVCEYWSRSGTCSLQQRVARFDERRDAHTSAHKSQQIKYRLQANKLARMPRRRFEIERAVGRLHRTVSLRTAGSRC
jgi:hypothetical protein